MPKDGENKGTTDSVRAAAKNSDTERDGSEAERGSSDRLHESAYGAAPKEKFVPKSYFEVKSGYKPNPELEQNISRSAPSLRFDLQGSKLGFERVSGLVENVEQAKEFQKLRRTVTTQNGELSAAQELYLIDLSKTKGMSLEEKQRTFDKNAELFDTASTLQKEVRQSRRFVNDGTYAPLQRYQDFQHLLNKKTGIQKEVNESCANLQAPVREALADSMYREWANSGLKSDTSLKNRIKNGFDPVAFEKALVREITSQQNTLEEMYKADPYPEYVREKPLDFFNSLEAENKRTLIDDVLKTMDFEPPSGKPPAAGGRVDPELEALEKLELISKPEPSGGKKDGSGSEGAAGAERVAEKNESEKAREKAEKLTQEKETQTRKGRNGSGIVGKIGKGGSLAILLGVGFEIINKNSAASSDSSPLIGGR